VDPVSIATSPRHVVTVQRMTREVSDSGTPRFVQADGGPITVRCNTYPLSAQEVVDGGFHNDVTRKVYLHWDVWPGDQHSVITYEGDTWEQIGPAVVYDSGFQTKHTQITIRKRGVANGRANP
jgi:hypothetical protein